MHTSTDLYKKQRFLFSDKRFAENAGYKDYLNLLKQSSSIEELLNKILSTKPLSSFYTAQLLVHSKGTTQCQSMNVDRNGNFNSKSFDVSHFTKLLTLVKKSKNKKFDQTQIKSETIQFLGTFLAKNFSFSSHDLLLVISRNDFLPISDDDINSFNRLTLFIPNSLRTLIGMSKKQQNENIFNRFINLHPEFKALSKEGKSIITTKKKIDSKTIHIDNQHSLELISLSQDSITIDLKHMERVLLLGELLNTLRHELSNPIFGINLAAELMYTTHNEHELISDFSQQILRAAKRSQNILDNFSKLYANQSEATTCDIRNVINETITLTKSETKMIPKKTSWNNFENEENYFLKSNPTWISQIFFNIVVNAAQALTESETVSPEINIDIKYLKDSISIQVNDNGPGICTAIISNLFTPFFTTKNKGTGLGLSICKNLVKRLGGKLDYGNNKDVGAFFCVTIPVKL